MKDIASALIASLIPLLITTFFAWLGNRNYQAKRSSMIESARQRIEFVNVYVSSQCQVVSSQDELEGIRKAAAQELRDIKKVLDCRLQSLQQAAEKSENYLFRFLLLYRMHSGMARFFRYCFFATLFLATCISYVFAVEFFKPSAILETGFGLSVILTVMVSAPGVLLAFVFRWLAKRFDRR
ncbi:MULTISPECIES: hypothetical protein [Aphanothece]|uniref:hypothetical protein n=1 Tax=Aphanothece TaxID=1121 RepID=UPI003985214D